MAMNTLQLSQVHLQISIENKPKQKQEEGLSHGSHQGLI